MNKDRVIVIDGILGSRERIHNLKGATNMQLSQGLFGKHFNYGTIIIYFMGGNEVHLTDIQFPYHYLKQIQSLMDKGYIEQ